MKIRLVKESLGSKDWSEIFMEEQGLVDTEDVDLFELAIFIDERWDEITGLPEEEKDAEQYFPSEVEEILSELGVDYDDFSYEWGDMREGNYVEDLDDEEEDEDEDE